MPFAVTEKMNKEQAQLVNTGILAKVEWLKKRIGDMVYIVEESKYTHKRHQNHLQKRRLNDSNDVPQTEEEPLDTIFDIFDLDPLQSTPEKGWPGRKRKFTDPLMIEPKRKKILIALLRSKRLGEPYPSAYNAHFSPSIVLRYFAASRTIPELS